MLPATTFSTPVRVIDPTIDSSHPHTEVPKNMAGFIGGLAGGNVLTNQYNRAVGSTEGGIIIENDIGARSGMHIMVSLEPQRGAFLQSDDDYPIAPGDDESWTRGTPVRGRIKVYSPDHTMEVYAIVAYPSQMDPTMASDLCSSGKLIARCEW